jgi:5,10-methylene-tetrahydrofolate dehydrogenase/methenyl tetrahydrofolate cyclohydrolase
MTAKLIKGTEIRDIILKEIGEEVKKIKEKHGKVPGLVTILVGQNPASISYVTAKIEAAKPRLQESRTISQRRSRNSSFLPHRQV